MTAPFGPTSAEYALRRVRRAEQAADDLLVADMTLYEAVTGRELDNDSVEAYLAWGESGGWSEEFNRQLNNALRRGNATRMILWAVEAGQIVFLDEDQVLPTEDQP